MRLKLYFMKCSERKISQCILAFMSLLRSHSIITFSLRGEGVHENANICERGEIGGCHINANVRKKIFLIEHLVRKLLTIVTRFPVLLKTSDLKKTISRSCLRLQINYVFFFFFLIGIHSMQD